MRNKGEMDMWHYLKTTPVAVTLKMKDNNYKPYYFRWQSLVSSVVYVAESGSLANPKKQWRKNICWGKLFQDIASTRWSQGLVHNSYILDIFFYFEALFLLS